MPRFEIDTNSDEQTEPAKSGATPPEANGQDPRKLDASFEDYYQSLSGRLNIDQFMRFEVAENPDQEHLNKTISAVKLKIYDNTTLTCHLVFEKPSHITPDISEPDTLVVEILMPELIIDPETLEHLSYDRVEH